MFKVVLFSSAIGMLFLLVNAAAIGAYELGHGPTGYAIFVFGNLFVLDLLIGRIAPDQPAR